MSWLHAIGLVVVIAIAAGLSGLKPGGTRPVARTRLMTAARVILALALVLLAVVLLGRA